MAKATKTPNGTALLNGTQAMASVGTLALLKSEELARAGDAGPRPPAAVADRPAGALRGRGAVRAHAGESELGQGSCRGRQF